MTIRFSVKIAFFGKINHGVQKGDSPRLLVIESHGD